MTVRLIGYYSEKRLVMIKIKVPATSANLGPGFDSIGIALTLYNTLRLEEWDDVVSETVGGINSPIEKDNLIVQTIRDFYKNVGKKFTGVRITQEINIPMTRGLGSSSACIVAGVYAANKFLGDIMSEKELIDYAVNIEGHPDNIVPAAAGGLIISATEGEKTEFIKHDISDDISFAAFIPQFEMKTSFARKILPTQVTLSDAIYNISRASLLTAAFIKGDYEKLRIAMQDVIHQPHRLPLIAGCEEIFKLSEELGAYASYLSGAGPTIISIINKDNGDFIDKAEKYILENNMQYNVMLLKADNKGIQIF